MNNNLDIKIPNKYNVIIKDDFVSSLFKKTYRLTIAISMISRDLESDLQLQQKLRNSAYELLDFVSLFLDDFSQIYDFKKLNHIIFLLNRVETYTNCATGIGLFSTEKGQIINQAINQIMTSLEEYISSQNKTVENLSISMEKEKVILDQANKEASHKGHIKDSSKTNVLNKSEVTSNNQNLKDNSDRKAQIIRIIGRKGNISIKDISSQIKDCSEKTIQRELTKLVNEGVLIKKGERRWSTYSMVF